MKRFLIILLLLFTVSLCGCDPNRLKVKINPTSELKLDESLSLKRINNVSFPTIERKRSDVSRDFNEKYNVYTSNIMKEIFKTNGNCIFSPLSLYYSLAMLSEGYEGEAKQELSSLLNCDDSLLRTSLKSTYISNYYSNENGVNKIANSLWVNSKYDVNKTFTDILQDNYFIEAFKTSFNNTSKKEIAKWINHQTAGLLDFKPTDLNLNSTTPAAIINTVYFNNKWKVAVESKDVYKDKFDSTAEIDYLKHTVKSFYYNYDQYEAIYDYYENDNSIKFIMPKDGFTIDDILDLDIINSNYDDSEAVNATISIPKIEVTSEYSLNNALRQLGVNKIFEGSSANITTNKSFVVEEIKQNAKIIFNEKGTEAAAVTITVGCSAEPFGRDIEFKLNKPYIYIIYDCNDVPLFVGAVRAL